MNTYQKTKEWATPIFILDCVYQRKLWLVFGCLTLVTAVGCKREPAAGFYVQTGFQNYKTSAEEKKWNLVIVKFWNPV